MHLGEAAAAPLENASNAAGHKRMNSSCIIMTKDPYHNGLKGVCNNLALVIVG